MMDGLRHAPRIMLGLTQGDVGPISKGCLATYQDAWRMAEFGEFSYCFYYRQDILNNLIAANDTCDALVLKAILIF
jgi:hypothetical protein